MGKSLTVLFFAKLGVNKYDEDMELFHGSYFYTSGALTPNAK